MAACFCLRHEILTRPIGLMLQKILQVSQCQKAYGFCRSKNSSLLVYRRTIKGTCKLPYFIGEDNKSEWLPLTLQCKIKGRKQNCTTVSLITRAFEEESDSRTRLFIYSLSAFSCLFLLTWYFISENQVFFYVVEFSVMIRMSMKSTCNNRSLHLVHKSMVA